MNKSIVAGCAVGMCLGAFATSFSYQGVLKDATGGALSDASKTISFRLYDQVSGGVSLWGRTFPVTLDSDGLFTLELTDGSGSLADSSITNTLDDVLAQKGNGDLYLGLTVADSSGEISPRQKLLPVPVASFAQNVDTAKGDFTVNGVAKLNGISVTGDATFSGETKIASLTVNGGATLGGDIKTTGTLTAQGGLAVPSGTSITFGGRDLIPSGTIWMWWGDKDNLPAGWVLCNGENGTPDLRDRFPVGAGTSYEKGATGGEATHTLTVDEMPSHTHTYTFNGGDLAASWKDQNNFYNSSDHYQNSNTKTTNATGGDRAHENRPPYLAIYFIMKK